AEVAEASAEEASAEVAEASAEEASAEVAEASAEEASAEATTAGDGEAAEVVAEEESGGFWAWLFGSDEDENPELDAALETEEDAREAVAEISAVLAEEEANVTDLEKEIAALQDAIDLTKENIATATAERQAYDKMVADYELREKQIYEDKEIGIELYHVADEKRDEYYHIKGDYENLNARLKIYKEKAAYFKGQIPEVKENVAEATQRVVEARSAYDRHRMNMHSTTANMQQLQREIIVIKPAGEDLTEEEASIGPLEEQLKLDIANLRKVEGQAVDIYRKADYNAFMAKRTQRELDSIDEGHSKAKSSYNEAVKQLKPYGELDPYVHPDKRDEHEGICKWLGFGCTEPEKSVAPEPEPEPLVDNPIVGP
ncbi:MAG: hypothetical protein MK193_09875, partial [Lentisphaeria bacterium]|nr:hypothetical protein [Lentisphaeria bacterium]